MELFLARPRGFCAGVNRAIAVVHKALDRYNAPVYVLHEIVHNTHVIAELTKRGAVFVEHLTDIPKGAIAIFSAHGVSRAVVAEAKGIGLHTINATCPLVSRVHRRVRRLNRAGCDVLVIGHKGHPEVVGTCGHADGAVHVISTPEEVYRLKVQHPERVGYVTQTTLSVDDTREILAAVHARFPNIREPERTDICYATTNRQAAVRRLAEQVDLVLIVGSRNSSNSNRLREAAHLMGTPAYLIDDASEIDDSWLDGISRVGISAGASAPEHLVTGVIGRLQEQGAGEPVEMEGEQENISFIVPELEEIPGKQRKNGG
ncbi:MAG: 4-hydroxy-3-methylbut-2-enyl diphosphate reductase [Desulfobulbus propionicus]|nr:MAG: 4-hydroxy-3-methylbut-2-enyl diphosphate reductase [Desulfobulbus propionicus]